MKYSFKIFLILFLFISACKLFCPNDELEQQTTQRIAFLRDRDSNNELYIDNDIWIMDMDGSNQTQLTFDIDDVSGVVFSPDGQKICFQIIYDYNNSDIYIMNVDGSDLMNLTNDDKFHQKVIFTQDGQQLIFDTELPRADLFIINIDGSNLTNITNSDTTWESKPVFIPNENLILYRFIESDESENFQLYTIELDGSNRKCLTCQYENLKPSFHQLASGGKKILFLSRSGHWINSNTVFPLYTMDLDGSNLEMIYQFDVLDNPTGIYFSPNDEYFIYKMIGDANSEGYILNEVHKVDIEGTNDINLTDIAGIHYFNDFSYDGEYLLYTKVDGAQYGLYICNKFGNNQELILDGIPGGVFQPISN